MTVQYTLDDVEVQRLNGLVAVVAERGAYFRMKGRFVGACIATVALALIAGAGVMLFAWGANPPADLTGELPVVVRAPTTVQLQLSDAGKDRLKRTLGEECVTSPIAAVAVEDLDDGGWRVAVVKTDHCKAALADLSPTDGTLTVPPTS